MGVWMDVCLVHCQGSQVLPSETGQKYSKTGQFQARNRAIGSQNRAISGPKPGIGSRIRFLAKILRQNKLANGNEHSMKMMPHHYYYVLFFSTIR
jgi:hypothetical protein